MKLSKAKIQRILEGMFERKELDTLINEMNERFLFDSDDKEVNIRKADGSYNKTLVIKHILKKMLEAKEALDQDSLEFRGFNGIYPFVHGGYIVDGDMSCKTVNLKILKSNNCGGGDGMQLGLCIKEQRDQPALMALFMDTEGFNNHMMIWIAP